MKKTVTILLLVLLTGLGFTVNANAQDWNCSDLTWSSERLETSPNVAQNCLDVVEKNGVPYAKLHARVVRQSVNSTVVQYQLPDGSWSPTERVFPGGFSAEIEGRDIKIQDLPLRQEVNVYVKPEDNFSYPVAAAVVAAAPAPAPAPVPVPEPEPAPVYLPTTATQVSLFALLGGLMVLLGGAVAMVRTRL
jgi:hypothetical protein